MKEEKTLGVKFSNNVYMSPDIARRLGHQFEEKDLSDNPIFGKALVFDKDGNHIVQERNERNK